MKNIPLNLFQIFFWFLILALPLGQLTRLQLSQTAAVTALDLLAAGLNLSFLLHSLSRRHSIRLHPLLKPFFLFLGVALLSLLLSFPTFGPRILTSGLHLLRLTNFAALAVTLTNLRVQKLLQPPTTSLLLTVSLSWAILGLLQYIFLPDTRFLYLLGWDDHLNRIISTIFDPGFTGILLLQGLILYETSPRPRSRLIFTLLFLALSLTYARSVFLVYFIVYFLLGFYRGFRFSLSRILLLTVFILLLPRSAGEGVNLERTYSISARASTSITSWDLFRHRPLLGYGFNAYSLALDKQPVNSMPDHANAPDNSYLLLLTTTGILGTLVFIYWQFTLLRTFLHLSPTMFLMLIAIIAHSFTNNTLFHPFVQVWFWLLLTDSLSLTRSKKHQTPAPTHSPPNLLPSP